MTVWRNTIPTPSLSLPTTQQWYGLITDNDKTAYREEVRALPGQQSLPQHEQDKEADRGLQEKEGRTLPHSHRPGCSGAG